MVKDMGQQQDEELRSGIREKQERHPRGAGAGPRPGPGACCATNKVSGQGRAAGNAISKDVHATHSSTCQPHARSSLTTTTAPFCILHPPRTRTPPFLFGRVSKTHARAASLRAVETGPATSTSHSPQTPPSSAAIPLIIFVH